MSPSWIRETLLSLGMDGADEAPVSDVARAYVEAVEGSTRGETIMAG